MKKRKYCNGAGIVAHILFIAGIYILTWGLIGSASVGTVLQSPIFWGLLLILAGFCSIAASKTMK